MTEADWQAGADPEAMLNYLAGKASTRKLRLFACACVRRYWSRLRAAPRAREAVETAERYAEGEVGEGDVGRALERAEPLLMDAPLFEAYAYMAAVACAAEDPEVAARNAQEFIRQQAVRDAAYEVPPGQDEAEVNAEASAAECRAQCELLREVFGNPFREVNVDPAWLGWGNGSAAHMAQLIHENGQWDDLPYLADALEDAGCGEESLLRHLREPREHVRGCWALDAVLRRA
jgi:hypothetical protein